MFERMRHALSHCGRLANDIKRNRTVPSPEGQLIPGDRVETNEAFQAMRPTGKWPRVGYVTAAERNGSVRVIWDDVRRPVTISARFIDVIR